MQLGRGVATGGVWGIYTLPKSGQVNFLWGNNDVRAVIEFFIPPQKNFYTSPKQISATPLQLGYNLERVSLSLTFELRTWYSQDLAKWPFEVRGSCRDAARTQSKTRQCSFPFRFPFPLPPFPCLYFLCSFPLSSLSFPSPLLCGTWPHPLIQLGVWGSAVSSLSGFRQSPAIKTGYDAFKALREHCFIALVV